MFFKKLIAAAFMAVAATSIATATAHGEATLANVDVTGVDGPVAYTASLAGDHSSALVTLAAGSFVVTPDSVTVLANDGAVVGTIPTTLRTEAGQNLAVTPRLDSSGTQLTLTPVGGPTQEAVAYQDMPGVQQAMGPMSVMMGAALGCAIGVMIGIWFFLVGAIIGCAVGWTVGAMFGFFTPSP
ncbi:hypothetical protein [Nocardia sp. NBC_01009]|uniref:hypothetical protein n=1 Tax=Nocardia sp. NBC_01009 TaxID=2975996 RepID=UPI0038679923|nr:hypothetical protein OHA42_24150 [Nocardia sp. NBC_01009]